MKRTEITARDLGITVERKERELFKWFLASYLFGKRVRHDIARQTWEVFMKRGIDSPKKIADTPSQQIVGMFDEGNYRRYGESNAHGMIEMARELVRDHHGNLLTMFDSCDNENQFESSLMKLKGFSQDGVKIFMREARPVLVRA